MAAPALSTFKQGLGSVGSDNLNTFLQTCDTFAQLRGLEGVPGLMVFARGGIAIGDGLQGAFYWNASTTATDNGQSIIKPTGAGPAGAWVLIPPTGTGAALASAGQTLALGWSYNVVTTNPLTASIFLPPVASGRVGQFLTVLDESNNAATNNFTIQAQPSQLILNANTSTTANTYAGNLSGKVNRFTLTSVGTWHGVAL